MKENIDRLVKAKLSEVDGFMRSERAQRILARHPWKKNLLIVRANDDLASEIYINNKVKILRQVGLYPEVMDVPSSWSTPTLIQRIKERAPFYQGILLQLPVYEHIDSRAVIEQAIEPPRDVDRIRYDSLGRIMANAHGGNIALPCTVQACLDIMNDFYKDNLKGLQVAVLGKSTIVGAPLAAALAQRNATVMHLNSSTNYSRINWEQFDCVITATGAHGFLQDAHFKRHGQLIIDVGIARIGGKVVGDVAHTGKKSEFVHITPVPGGVGRLTVANVAYNMMKLIQGEF